MADYQNQPAQRSGYGQRAEGLAIDQGLRTYMGRVYNWMALGVAFTALVSLGIMNYQPALQAIAGSSMMWVFFIGILAMGFIAPKMIFSGNKALAHLAFWGYCALWGLAITPAVYSYFMAGQASLVIRALAITAVTFGALSIYGYTTKRDLSGFGTFFVMATIGLILAMIANFIFFQSDVTGAIISGLVVLVFAGITAWETQEIKQMYYAADNHGVRSSKAIFGAFLLYGSFVTIFIHLLNLLGFMSGE